jgi:hypothetical protein
MPKQILSPEKFLDPYLLPQQTKDILKRLLKNVNKNKGTINCARVALRVNDIIRRGPDINNQKPVAASFFYGIKTNPVFNDKGELTSSNTTSKVLLNFDLPDVQSNKTPEEYFASEEIDVDQEKIEVVDINDDNDDKGLVNIGEQARRALSKSHVDNLKEDLKRLPKDKYGRCYGLLIYTHKNKPKESGHLCNFHIDANNKVYFIDAQGQDPNTFVKDEPERDKELLEEIFYMYTVGIKKFRHHEPALLAK